MKTFEQFTEGSLHKWFKGSKSKDGKGGWVNVVTGGTCASDEPGEGTPKCVSSSKRASMTKAERLSASRRKKKADPGQQQKSGAAKPTYVATDKKKKVNEDKVLKKVAKELTKASKMHKGQAEKIKKHADDMKKVDEACWKGYKAYGMKKKGGKMVPNCKPVGSVKESSAVLDANTKIGKDEKKKKKEAELRRLLQHAIAVKKGQAESVEVVDERTLSSYIPSDRQGEARRANLDYTKAQLKKKEDESTKNRGDLSKRDAGKMAKEKLRTKKIMSMGEAKVDKGRSDYGKASIRNYRRSGPDTLEPAMFDPENKRGKTIDKRREEHKARRGVKKAKVPTYTKEETVDEAKSAAWQRKEGKRESGGLNQKGVDSYRRENPGSKLKTAVTTKPSKLKKGSKSANRRKSFCARMSGMKKKLTSAKTANDPDSRINKSLRKWNCSYEPDGTPIMEEDKAFNFVLDKIRKEVGKDGYVSKNNPRKPATPQQKAKVRAHQAKVDKENAAARAKDPSQGRYPKG
jgi:hypothetical protein